MSSNPRVEVHLLTDALPDEPIEHCLLRVRYSELLAKSERQRKRIALLERSRADMRKHIARTTGEL
jgi:hypothetical protein